MEILSQETRDWLALWLVPGLGPRRLQRLVEAFSSPEKVLNATQKQLTSISGISSEICEKIQNARNSELLQKELSVSSKLGLKILSINDERYPTLLKETYSAPPVLYVKGEIDLASRFPVGIVGSRKSSYYGKAQTKRMIKELSEFRSDAVIISGLALGIDTVAHSEAIRAGLKTMAVLAGGLSDIYPSSNKNLAREIIDSGGALITEFPVTSKPLAGNFPLRNRIISGLSKAILVMEAAEKSGALITANYALEQNREVYAVPGPIDSPLYVGTNRLIQKGNAKLLMSLEDVLSDFPVESSQQISFLNEEYEHLHFSKDESRVLEHLQGGSMHTDILSRESGLPVAVLLSVLATLEMKGAIVESSAGYYRSVLNL